MLTKSAPFDLKAFRVISDNGIFLQQCCTRGFQTQALSKTECLPAQSLVFSFCNEAARRTFEIAKNTPSKKSIFCAVHVFEPSVSSALYGLDLILKSDFNDALRKQRLILKLLDTYKTFTLEGNNTQASVIISERATPYAMIEEDTNSDFIHSVAEFFEVHYAHMNKHSPYPFQLKGHLKVSGILTVLRKQQTLPDKELKKHLNI